MIYWYDDGVGWWVGLVAELKRRDEIGRREGTKRGAHAYANCGIKTMATQVVKIIHMH